MDAMSANKWLIWSFICLGWLCFLFVIAAHRWEEAVMGFTTVFSFIVAAVAGSQQQ